LINTEYEILNLFLKSLYLDEIREERYIFEEIGLDEEDRLIAKERILGEEED